MTDTTINTTNDEHEHEHTVQEVLGAFASELQQSREKLRAANVHMALMKRTIEALLPIPGDTITVSADGLAIKLPDNTDAKNITFFRTEGGELDLRAD